MRMLDLQIRNFFLAIFSIQKTVIAIPNSVLDQQIVSEDVPVCILEEGPIFVVSKVWVWRQVCSHSDTIFQPGIANMQIPCQVSPFVVSRGYQYLLWVHLMVHSEQFN